MIHLASVAGMLRQRLFLTLTLTLLLTLGEGAIPRFINFCEGTNLRSKTLILFEGDRRANHRSKDTSFM